MQPGPEADPPEVESLRLRRGLIPYATVLAIGVFAALASLWPKPSACAELADYVCRTGIAHCGRVQAGLESAPDELCEEIHARKGKYQHPGLYDGLKELIPDLAYTAEEAKRIKIEAARRQGAGLMAP